MMFNKNVDLFIENLPEDLQVVASSIRSVLLEVIPEIDERFSYKLPFYHYYGMFCYLTTLRGKRLHLTFMRGKDLTELYPQLEQKGRALAASVSFASMKDFNKAELSELITTAAI